MTGFKFLGLLLQVRPNREFCCSQTASGFRLQASGFESTAAIRVYAASVFLFCCSQTALGFEF